MYQAAARAYPDLAVLGLDKRLDAIAGQAIRGGVGLQLVVLVASQTFGRANPEGAIGGGEQALNVVAWEGRFPQRRRSPVGDSELRVLIEEDEIVAIEADQTDLGAQPEEAVSGLRECLDSVLRETVLDDPGLASVAGEGGVWFERRGAWRDADKNREEPDNAAGWGFRPDRVGVDAGRRGCRIQFSLQQVRLIRNVEHLTDYEPTRP